jgi:putative transposase
MRGQGGTSRAPTPRIARKTGVTRHILTDGRGVPLAAEITGTNVHDKWFVGQTLDAVVLRAPRGPRRPEHLCLDKGYDYEDAEAAVRARRITPHSRRRGEKPLLGAPTPGTTAFAVCSFAGNGLALTTLASSTSPAASSLSARRYDIVRIGS